MFLQIARALTAEIRRGRLRPGERLPGSRSLAESLGVHRNTVIAAYDELAAEGWIHTEQARGTFVAANLPIVRPRRFAPRPSATRPSLAPTTAFELGPELAPPPAPPPKGALVLAGGSPDLGLVPRAALARAYRRALTSPRGDLLAYGDAQGHPHLRRELARMLGASRGVCPDDDQLLVTRGAQMALSLLAEALLRPSDIVAVEGYGYRPAWSALARRATLVPLPVDDDGLEVAALARLLETTPVRAVYLTPHHQFPTTVALSAPRRLELLALAERHRFAILEDDYDHEIHYRGRPILPLASADQHGAVVYVGTLSKVLAPGLRLGYVVAPAPLIRRLVALRTGADRQGDLALEHAVAELFEDGEIERHVRRMRRVYAARRAALARALELHLGGALSFRPAPGGMAIWARAAPGIDVDAWAAAAREAGVVFATAKSFTFDGHPAPHLRIGFASLDEAALEEAVRRMAVALPRRAPRRRG